MKTLLSLALALVFSGCQSAPQSSGNGGPVASNVSDVKFSIDPALPYLATRSHPVTYEVDFSAVVTPPYKSKLLKVWLPMSQSDAGQEVTEVELSTFPMKVEPKIGTEKVFGNTFAYFEFHDAQGAQIIRHKFKIKVYELRWNLDPSKVGAVANWPASFDPYRKGEAQAVVTDDRFDTLLKTIVPQRGNPLTDMSAVMDYEIREFQYDHVNASLMASSVHALEQKRGHCSDYHGFCSAMGRLLGTPTRVTYGINPFPKNSPSHCKMEAFLPPYGWVSFDVSETQNLIGAIKKMDGVSDDARQALMQKAKQRLLSGFRDNTWFLQTRGTDYDLEPKAVKKVAVVRTIYAEADGQALPETDSANKNQRAFSWMTVHQYIPDRTVAYPFKDIKSLE